MRKQQLLRKHRQRKRLLWGAFLLWECGLLGIGGWGLGLVGLLGAWLIHEACWADHIFYHPNVDYQHQFPEHTRTHSVRWQGNCLQVEGVFSSADTLILAVEIRATGLGYWFDPRVWIGRDRQDFERGTCGRRYLNLSGQEEALQQGLLSVRGQFCRLDQKATLYVMSHTDYAQQSLMIIAPHADDAELAAFGLYRRASEATLVTLTQGELEAERYTQLGLSPVEAAHLKGRLRCWDSMAIPLWGGVPSTRCVQLGYYGLQLSAMAEHPDQAFGSRQSGEVDVRRARCYNALSLPSDHDGQPTWRNLCADLQFLLEQRRPQVLVLPHPELDPHPDHRAATAAVLQVLAQGRHSVLLLLFYANHLHDNDRWPMGPADHGVALPPVLTPLTADSVWSPVLDKAARMDKAQALAMHHDLNGALSFKKRVRRCIQRLLLGRQWPKTGENEFFRKAVRRHELFWVRPWD